MSSEKQRIFDWCRAARRIVEANPAEALDISLDTEPAP